MCVRSQKCKFVDGCVALWLVPSTLDRSIMGSNPGGGRFIYQAQTLEGFVYGRDFRRRTPDKRGKSSELITDLPLVERLGA